MKYLFCLLILTNLNSFSQSAVSNITGKISGYYLVDETILGGNNPVAIGNKVLLYTIGNEVRGYYGWAAQGSESFYFVGKKKGLKIMGKKYSFYSNDSTVFIIDILPKGVSLISPMGKVVVPISKIGFPIENLKIYEDPSTTSKIILENYSSEKNDFNIVEIGQMDKIDENVNIWYKIKNGNYEGWAFGILDVF
jgi:hypothetical protein